MRPEQPGDLTDAERTLAWLAELPEAGLYGLMAGVAAAKAIVPPLPADSIIILSALLVGQGTASLWLAGACTVVAAMLGALIAYEVPRALGPAFLRLPVVRVLLRPSVLQSVHHVHSRFGPLALFIARFMPGIRHAVPVFAGMARMRRRDALPPILLATAIWYAVLVLFGGLAGHRFDQALREGRVPTEAILILLAALVALYLLGRLALWVVRRNAPEPSEP